MAGTLRKLGTNAAWHAAKRRVQAHKTESTLALGLLGAALTAKALYAARQRQTAMRGKVVVITGGSRGLGLEIARQFGLAGAHLVLAARKEDELRNALGILTREGAIPNPSAAHIVVTDISKQQDCNRLIASAAERYGRVDVLVNCAGIMLVAPMEDQTTDAFHEAMDINFFGQLYTVQAVLPQMLARRSGSIINISSIGGKIPVPHMLPYVASKFALAGFSEGLHEELRHKGIRVTTVCPGLLRTGSFVQVKFAGDVEKEYRWFSFGAKVPGVAASSRGAARKIYNAAVAGKAEITITPQAWLGARLFGMAPNPSQFVAALANHLLLPASNGNQQVVTGADLEPKRNGPWSQHLQAANNQ